MLKILNVENVTDKKFWIVKILRSWKFSIFFSSFRNFKNSEILKVLIFLFFADHMLEILRFSNFIFSQKSTILNSAALFFSVGAKIHSILEQNNFLPTQLFFYSKTH